MTDWILIYLSGKISTQRAFRGCSHTCFGSDQVGHVQLCRNLALLWKFDGPIEKARPYMICRARRSRFPLAGKVALTLV